MGSSPGSAECAEFVPRVRGETGAAVAPARAPNHSARSAAPARDNRRRCGFGRRRVRDGTGGRAHEAIVASASRASACTSWSNAR